MAIDEDRGFLILRKDAGQLIDAYFDQISQTNLNFFLHLQKLILPKNPRSYRGFSREPLGPINEFQESRENEAQQYITNLIDQCEIEDIENECILPDIAIANRAFTLLSKKNEWEVLEVRRNSFREDDRLLGYDIGYWGGDYFSIICDSAVTPRWHPPQPDAFDSLTAALNSINDNFLFPNPIAATEFREYYRSQYWAETEDIPGEFCIVQVSTVSSIIP